MIKVQSREDFLKEVKKHLPDNPTAVEIGCYRGDFTERILKIINPYMLYGIDSFQKAGTTYSNELSNLTTSYSNYEDFEFAEQRFIGTQVFIQKAFSYDAVKDYINNKTDFIYIDACHLYECVKQDLNDWLPKLKKNGLMCGHDYIKLSNFGVIEAVDEFCNEHNFEMIIFNNNGGDYALKRK
jgi:hypothetical protein